MIVRCEDCDELMCTDCEGEEIEDGNFVCDGCADDRDEDHTVVGASTPRAETCGKCGRITRDYAVKNEGIRCITCAHKLELELLGGEHDAANCQICTPSKAA